MQPNLSDILSHVPEDLRKLIVRKTFLPGEFIVRKGENAKRVYIMLKGSTRVSNEFVSGQRYTFATLKAGQVIGDLEVLAHQPVYSATNEAITSCDVLAMSDDTFIRWFREDSDFAFIVAEQLAAKMYPTSDENGRIKFQPSLERLYQYLLKRLGNVQTDLFILHTSRQQIADDIGTSVKTVNRGVAKLKERGLIRLVHGKITMDKEQQKQLREASELME